VKQSILGQQSLKTRQLKFKVESFLRITRFLPFFGVFFIWSTVAPEDFIKGRITSPAIE
jgi:hypothetical protein